MSWVCEVTSPQAFEGLRMSNREARSEGPTLGPAAATPATLWAFSEFDGQVRRTDCTLATVDHNIPTSSRKNFKAGIMGSWDHGIMGSWDGKMLIQLGTPNRIGH